MRRARAGGSRRVLDAQRAPWARRGRPPSQSEPGVGVATRLSARPRVSSGPSERTAVALAGRRPPLHGRRRGRRRSGRQNACSPGSGRACGGPEVWQRGSRVASASPPGAPPVFRACRIAAVRLPGYRSRRAVPTLCVSVEDVRLGGARSRLSRASTVQLQLCNVNRRTGAKVDMSDEGLRPEGVLGAGRLSKGWSVERPPHEQGLRCWPADATAQTRARRSRSPARVPVRLLSIPRDQRRPPK